MYYVVGGIWLINEEKTSCANDRTFMSFQDPLMYPYLEEYFTQIRPLLARQGLPINSPSLLKVWVVIIIHAW